MDELLRRLDPFDKEDWKQFRRRCKLYIQMHEDYLVAREYDFETDTYINDTYLINPMKDLIQKTKSEPKMTPQQISDFLVVPLLPDELKPTKKNRKTPKIDPPLDDTDIHVFPCPADFPPPPF